MQYKGNILLVANWESGVGYAWWLMENFWIEIALHFSSRGISSHLLYPKITGIPNTITSSGIRVAECDFRNHSLPNLRQLRKYITSENIKYIYLSDWPPYSAFYVLLKLWGVRKIVIHEHTPGERSRPGPIAGTIKTKIQRMPWITADHFIAVSDYILERFVNITCIPAWKCSVAPNGIPPIDLEHADDLYAYRTFDISEDRRIVVTTGRASVYKGIDFFIDCANVLVNQRQLNNLHFLFCGDGPDMALFKSQVSDYGLDEYFTFAGKRSDIRQILPSCYIGFHAATGEVGYSLSILEYMSAGLITIVPDNPSVARATTDKQNGLLYRPRDLQSAVHTILYAIEHTNHRQITENAINLVKHDYDIEKTNRQLIDALDAVFR